MRARDFSLYSYVIHDFMALSYGATFISTSAIVGFGGVAANLGMGLLWLTVFNIWVGVFLAFVVFGNPTWAVVDPLLVALPLSALVAVVVSLATRPLPEKHVAYVFGAARE